MTTTFREPGDDRNDDFWYNFGYDALDLSIESYAYGEHEPGTHGLSDGHINLDEVSWETLTLNGQVVLPEGLGDYVCEDRVDIEDACRLIVRGDSIETHNRFVAAEIDEFPESSRIPFQAELERREVAGTVELEPVLVREATPTSDDFRYGQTPGLKLADGKSFQIRTEGESDEGSFLPIKTKSFDEPREDHVFHLDHSHAKEPTLYINSNVNLLPTALKTGAPYGPKRWTKETLERLIGQSVWVELVLWTAADLSDGECRHEWQEDVLTILAEVGDDESPEEVAHRLEAQISNPERIDTLVETTNEVIQDYLEIDEALESLLEEVL